MFRVVIIVSHASGNAMTTNVVDCVTKDGADITAQKASEATPPNLRISVIKLY